MSLSTQCPTVLLDDSPAAEDELGADNTPEHIGPSTNVAAAIADLILSTQEGGKVIGLEGSWGSGKSTIVRMVSERLNALSGFQTIQFDAWAHEGDPLRRTFLEHSIARIIKSGWVDSEKWRKKLTSIAEKKRTSRERTVPKLTGFGVLLAASTLPSSVGMSFISESVKRGLSLDWTQPVSRYFLVGSLLACTPAFIFLWKVPSLLRKSKETDEPFDWGIFSSTQSHDRETETFESPNPTAIEFSSAFRELLADALLVDNKRRLLIVLDNLDRVDAHDALALWSTLQTFMQQDEESQGWFAQLWVLLPYDPKGIQRLWRNNDQTDTTPQYQSYLEKTIQIRFRVPVFVLSNWRKYLRDKLALALPRHTSSEAHDVYRVFAGFRPDSARTPTPREIKSHINQIGAVHRQRGDLFPLGHISYFLLRRADSSDLVDDLVRGSEPTSEAAHLLGPTLARNLAGLAFNLPPETAEQILLTEPLSAALAKNTTSTIEDLAVRYPGIFWVLLEKILSRFRATQDMTSLAHAASSIRAARLDDKATFEIDARDSTISLLCNSFLESSDWPPFNTALGKGLGAACALTNRPEFSGRVVELLRLRVKTNSVIEAPNDTAAESALLVVDEIVRLGHQHVIVEPFRFFENPTSWFSFCAKAERTISTAAWAFVAPNCSFEALDSHLAEVVGRDQLVKGLLAGLRVRPAQSTEMQWRSTARAVSERLSSTSKLNVKTLPLLLELLRLTESSFHSNDVGPTDLVRRGYIANFLHQAVSAKAPQLELLCIYLILRYDPTLQPPESFQRSAAGFEFMIDRIENADYEFANEFLEMLSKFDDHELLSKIADNAQAPLSLIQKCRTIAVDTNRTSALDT